MFTPITSSLGAVLMHLGTSTLLTTNSQILGCSGLLESVLSPSLSSTPTVAGLVLSSFAVPAVYAPVYSTADVGWRMLATAGLLVGFGTKWARGCASGHMLLGVPRGSRRSLVATTTFFATGVATAAITRSPPACGAAPCYTPTYPAAAPAIAMVLVATVGAWTMRRLPKTEGSRIVARFYSGFVFGLGLLVSGMAAPSKTLGFMSVTDWNRFDPSLMFLALIGMGGNAIVWRRRGDGPLLQEGGWQVPGGKVDWRLVAGSAIFGVGWGMFGVCPGPGVVAAMRNGWNGLCWVVAFFIGRAVAGFV